MFINLIAFPTVLSPLQLIFNAYKLWLFTSISLCISILSFLSPQCIYYFNFHCFIPQWTPCFSFVFQFVL